MEIVVVIPLYKDNPSVSEINSFIQCYKILGNYSIKIMTFKGLDLSVYKGPGLELDCIYFPKKYFSSIEGYNSLLKKHSFYRKFSSFDYLLIYQLDAWVFRDELSSWCAKGYDYIGSPWFEHFGSVQTGDGLWKVGNGGFSLRKVDIFLSMTLPLSAFSTIEAKNGAKHLFASIIQSFVNSIMLVYYIRFSKVNEDVYFTMIAEKFTRQKVYIPDVLEAARFSFEQSPGYLYQLVGTLPFGCHAWEKHEKDFWRDKITY